jgi:hypothetical protein
MTEMMPTPQSAPARSGLRFSQVLLIVLATIVLTVAVTYWFVRSYIYAADFEPVELDGKEQRVLDSKLRSLGYETGDSTATTDSRAGGESDAQWLRPERYSEQAGQRQVRFSERELNAIIANNRDLARKLAVDLSDDLISARLLVPLDPEFPILGGKTLRVSAGVEMALANGRPRVVLRGVSLMGVPIPAAWLGGLKNIDLISEFGDAGGFWQGFADGVHNISVRDGMLQVELKS